jgi:iron complex outermembrane recepter protein
MARTSKLPTLRHRDRTARLWIAMALLSFAHTANAEEAQRTDEAEAIAAIPVQALRDDASTSPLAPPPSSAIETIIVTAQKREQSLQDVPIAISAFSEEQLDARGIVSVKDLGTAVPGLQFSDLAGYNLIYLRGVGTDAFVPSADPSVATYLDGVYFPSGHNMVQSFGALERIEVLRGPACSRAPLATPPRSRCRRATRASMI